MLSACSASKAFGQYSGPATLTHSPDLTPSPDSSHWPPAQKFPLQPKTKNAHPSGSGESIYPMVQSSGPRRPGGE